MGLENLEGWSALVVLKGPMDLEALDEVLVEIGAKPGVSVSSVDGSIIIASTNAKQEQLEWAISEVKNKGRKSKRQLAEENRKALLAKTTWSQTDRDAALRMLLERMVP